MLSIRMALVTVAAGFCLWGLFSLLDKLKQPVLLRTAKAAVISGCDSLDSDDAQRMCPGLLCMKAVLDAKLVDIATPLKVAVEKRSGSKQRLIGGNAGAGSSLQYFACVLDGPKVVETRLLDSAQLDELAAQGGDWTLPSGP
jgi:hypothetical protein